MRKLRRATSRVAQLERRRSVPDPWRHILGDVSDEKLRRLDPRTRGASDSQRSFAEILIDGEPDERLIRWWELLGGNRIAGAAARAALLANVGSTR